MLIDNRIGNCYCLLTNKMADINIPISVLSGKVVRSLSFNNQHQYTRRRPVINKDDVQGFFVGCYLSDEIGDLCVT